MIEIRQGFSMSAKKPKVYETIIEHLLLGRSYRQIADILYKDEKQIRRWVSDPEFITLYKSVKREFLEQIKDTSVGAARDGMRLLADVVRNPKLDVTKERLAAAKYLIDTNARFAELIDTTEDDLFIPVPGAEDREDEE
jgi:hypothetical protein